MAFYNTIFLYLLFPLFVFSGIVHHGWANYDQTKELDYTGVVQKMTYENPHGMLLLNYKDKTWTVVLAPTSRMKARGLTSNMIQPKHTVRVVGYPHKEIENEMRAERIYVNGKKYELR